MSVDKGTRQNAFHADVCDTIIRNVTDNRDLLQLACINKVWRASAEAALWRRIDVTTAEWDIGGSRAQRTRLAYAKNVRELCVRGNDYEQQSYFGRNEMGERGVGVGVGAIGVGGGGAAGLARFAAAAGDGLRVLRLDGPALVTDDELWAVAARCGRLATLALTLSDADADSKYARPAAVAPSAAAAAAVPAVPSKAGPKSAPKGCSPDGFAAVAPNLRALRRLHLRLATALPITAATRAFESIAIHCSRLISFKIESAGSSNFHQTTPATTTAMGSLSAATATSAVASSIVKILAANSSSLTDLSLALWDLDPPAFSYIVANAAKLLNRLESLHIAAFSSLSELTPVVAANSASLKSLSLADMLGHPSIEPQHLAEFFADSSFQNPLVLESLSLEAIGDLVQVLPYLVRFINISSLRITPSRLSASVSYSRLDDLLVRILPSFSNLRRLVLCLSQNFALLAVADSCPLLESIDLIDASLVTDQGLILLVKGCPLLTHVSLGSAISITDISIKVLARSLSVGLKSLSLPFRASNLDLKNILQELATHCPNLESLLNIPWQFTNNNNKNNNVSEKDLKNEQMTAVFEILPQMKNLRRFGMCWIVGSSVGPAFGFGSSFSPVEVDELKKICPKLKTVLFKA